MGRSVPRMSSRNVHILDLPTWVIDDDGTLVVDVANPPVEGRPQGTISLDNKEGIALLYRTGNFEGNFLKGLALIWLRTVFLAMLGLACGTSLTFPVACLLAFLVYAAASGSDYIAEAFEYYADDPPRNATILQAMLWYPTAIVAKLAEGEIFDAAKIVVSVVGQGFMMIVPSLSEYAPADPLKNGVEIKWGTVAHAVLWVGVIWSGLVALIGWLFYTRRELAKVTV